MEPRWFLESIQAPERVTPRKSDKKIVIAIVDDGVNISHQDLAPFIWKNPDEIPANGIDDDGNGHVDDTHGWDVSDRNNQAVPPQERLAGYYHGTHLAGIVTQIVKRAYGENAADLIQIMSVKALADDAPRNYLIDGFKGVEYAIQAGADIIICAWSVAHISPQQASILRKAREKGILVVASAGNFPEDREQFPAADENVLAVAALNQQGEKSEHSNFGGFVDLSAPGVNIISASSRSTTGYEEREGTSQSAAMVAAAAAMLKLQFPTYSVEKVIACLKQSAKAIKTTPPRFVAKLGAGRLDINTALNCDLFQGTAKNEVKLVAPHGYLHFGDGQGVKKASWTISPQGSFNGLRFKPQIRNSDSGQSIVSFYTGHSSDARPVKSYRLSELPESIYLPGTTARITLELKGADKNLDGLLEYRAEPTDFSRLYCQGTKRLDTEGMIEDGSGAEDYSFNSDCKWLITAPPGKVVHFDFVEFDTEAKVDKIYFFNGAGTHEKIMAIFSGPTIPPKFRTWSNQVLIWFVTDGEKQRKGWKVKYRFGDA